MQESENIQWASRWDYILSSVPPQINYPLTVSIYTIFVILFLSFHAALIIRRSLHQGKEQMVKNFLIEKSHYFVSFSLYKLLHAFGTNKGCK